MSREQLAASCGYGAQWVGKLERGDGEGWPQPEVFNCLARALDVPVMRLLRASGLDVPEADHETLRWLLGQLDEDGLDMGNVRILLGHSTFTMTAIYSESGEQDAATSAYRRAYG